MKKTHNARILVHAKTKKQNGTVCFAPSVDCLLGEKGAPADRRRNTKQNGDGGRAKGGMGSSIEREGSSSRREKEKCYKTRGWGMRDRGEGTRTKVHATKMFGGWCLTLLGVPSRFGDTLLRICVICPPKRDCSSKGVKERYFKGFPFLEGRDSYISAPLCVYWYVIRSLYKQHFPRAFPRREVTAG